MKDETTGQVTNWGAEMGPPHGLQRRGWRRETLKIGEEVTVAGSLAKNGSQAHERPQRHDDDDRRAPGRDARRAVEPGRRRHRPVTKVRRYGLVTGRLRRSFVTV